MEKLKGHIPLPQDIAEYKSKIKLWFGGYFMPGRDIYISRAPARLDVMGGIADYSGSVVLQGTLNEAAIVGVQKRKDMRIIVKSYGMEREGFNSIVDFHLDEFYHNEKLKSFEKIREELHKDPTSKWAAYILGAFPVLLKEGILKEFPNGATICIKSNIPLGAGVSSSAAIEVATMMSLKSAYDLNLDAFQIARYCQMVENFIVGAPCGIMDQIASAMGKQNRLLALRCQPHELLKMVSVPTDIQFVGMDSRVKHSVGGSNYADTRTAAFMGRKILFNNVKTGSSAVPFGGYLCNVTLEEWESRYKNLVPETITGKEFVQEYESHDDPATRINPDKKYFPRNCASHPINENSRVQKFIKLLESYIQGDKNTLIQAGQLMYEAHESYTVNCLMGAPETDMIVDLVKGYGPDMGLYGAKITGGGSGGTIAILADKSADDLITTIASRYSDLTHHDPFIFKESSPGALELGTIHLKFD